jgi:hypothetical protein
MPTAPPELPPEKVSQAIRFTLNILGEPETEIQRQALTAFRAEDYRFIKRLSLTHPDDNYCRALGHLGSIQQPGAPVEALMAEAVGATADHVRQGVATRLGAEVANILQPD